MAITTRAGKGAPLSNAELDANFAAIASGDAAALTAANAYAESLVVGLWDDRGNYNASINTFPIAGGSGVGGAVLKGDIWTISIAGTLGGISLAPRQTIRATLDAPGQLLANWAVGLANTDLEDAIMPGITGRAPSQNAVATALALKANLASPTFSGPVGGITAAMVGLGNVNNTPDANKPVSTAQQAALDLKQDMAAEDASNGYAGLTLFNINFKNALGTVKSFFTNANTATRSYTFQDRNGTIADDTDLALKAPLASPTFTGPVGGITAAMVGLGNANNTSDANKPVSAAQQAALNSKAQIGGSGSQDFAVASLNGGALAGMRNRIINGDMRIDQRRNGAPVTVGPASSITYGADRCNFQFAAGATHTFQRQNINLAGFPYGTAVTIGKGALPAAGDGNFMVYSIEGYDVADIDYGKASAKTMTLSFWVYSQLPGKYSVAFLNDYLTPGTRRSYVTNYTINSAFTFELKTITIPGDVLLSVNNWNVTNGRGLMVIWDFGSGTDITCAPGAWVSGGFARTPDSINAIANGPCAFVLTGLQLEVSPVATPFERRPYGTELALCQRYFEVLQPPSRYFAGLTSAMWFADYAFKVMKRAAPSCVLSAAITSSTWNSGGTNAMPSSWSIAESIASGISLAVGGTSVAGIAFGFTVQASAEF
ncbi:hypothetical protein AAKU55_005256 [Oxalobacteraceae bacterium GrIS 1.11]